MDEDHKAKLLQLYARVRNILHAEWNPLNLGSLPLDEYDSYAAPLVRLLMSNANVATLAAQLYKLEQTELSSYTNSETRQHVAQQLVLAYLEIMG
jgi:hypothetical protein